MTRQFPPNAINATHAILLNRRTLLLCLCLTPRLDWFFRHAYQSDLPIPNDSCLAVSEETLRVRNRNSTNNEENSIFMHLEEVRNTILYLCNSKEGGSVREASNLWNALKKNLVHSEINAQSWWSTTGSLLATLLERANYQPGSGACSGNITVS